MFGMIFKMSGYFSITIKIDYLLDVWLHGVLMRRIQPLQHIT